MISSNVLRVVDEPVSALPVAPRTPEETGLEFAFLVELLAKILYVRGQMRLSDLVDHAKLLPGVLEPLLQFMRSREAMRSSPPRRDRGRDHLQPDRSGPGTGRGFPPPQPVRGSRAREPASLCRAGPAPVGGRHGRHARAAAARLHRSRGQGDVAGPVRRGDELGPRDFRLRARRQRQDLHRRAARRPAFGRHRGPPRHHGRRRGDSDVRSRWYTSRQSPPRAQRPGSIAARSRMRAGCCAAGPSS